MDPFLLVARPPALTPNGHFVGGTKPNYSMATLPDLRVVSQSHSASAVALAVEIVQAFRAKKGPQHPLVFVFDIDDTLIHDKDDEFFHINPHVVPMYNFAQSLKEPTHIYVVTARTDDPEVREFTLRQLEATRISLPPENLKLCPTAMRERGPKGVAEFKKQMRDAIAAKHGNILFTVGDQWTDIIPVASEEDIDRLRDEYGTSHALVVRLPPSDSARWGLKLPEM